MKKKTTKRDSWADEIAAIGEHLSNLGAHAHDVLGEAQQRYKKLDPATKKKVKAGMLALGAVAALAVVNKVRKK
ncbi:MAG: hypothetical protein V1846_02235 [Candidatus Komeilibacteria bacterium]